MKDASPEYIAHEDASRKKPAEIYHIWWSGGHWRYTSYDEAISYGGYTYTPAMIERDIVRYDSNLEVTEMNIRAAFLSQPLTQYIIQNPAELVWIDVKRIFIDGDAVDAGMIFIGQIKNVTSKGLTAQAVCVGFEHYLKQTIPLYRYQKPCSWRLFDTKCALSDGVYKLSNEIVSVDSTKTIFTSASFGAESANWWVFGDIKWGYHRRMIIKHDSNDIYVRYPILEINQPTIQVDVWPGCDGMIETCRDKFDNVSNFGGEPYIPLDNPALWD